MMARSATTTTLDPVELRFVASDNGTIAGHAAVWNARDSFGDYVQPGAFASTLRAHRDANTRPLMLMGHNPSAIVGVWHTIAEDGTGLHVTGNLVTDSTAGRDAYALLKAGAMNGLSIGFSTVRSDSRKGGGRNVREVKLHEISIVGRPAQPMARIASVRSYDQADAAGIAAFIRQCGERLKG
jgi:HK97 family phage prohead protease